MLQKSPLLNFRIKCDSEEAISDKNVNYDFISGLSLNELGEPIIKKYIESNEFDKIGETLITETREGIDQSERSECINHNFQSSGRFGETIMTFTREGVDQSGESANFDSSMNYRIGETILTNTREGIDQSSESVNFDLNDNLNYRIGETLLTKTREGIDSSECSYENN